MDMIKEKPAKKLSVPERAAEFIILLSNEGIKNLKVKDVSSAINKNKILLSCLFKREQKISIAGFIIREKMYRAAFTLEKDYTISIPELSERLGFVSPYQFEKAFDDYYCVLPGKYQALKKEIKNRNKKNAQPEKLKKIY